MVYTLPQAHGKEAVRAPGQAIVALRPRQMGTLPLLYPILKALRQTVNELVSTGEQRVPGFQTGLGFPAWVR